MSVLIQILTQYSENYAAFDPGWDGKSEAYKNKGGVQFQAKLDHDLADAIFMATTPLEREDFFRKLVADQSNRVARYEYVSHEVHFHKPTDISKEMTEAFYKLAV
jgi:hypothetical protein